MELDIHPGRSLSTSFKENKLSPGEFVGVLFYRLTTICSGYGIRGDMASVGSFLGC
jgi:hypothetical protein